MSDLLIYPKQAPHERSLDAAAAAAEAILLTRPKQAHALVIDSLPFLADERVTVFAKLAPYLAGRTISTVLAVAATPMDFLVAHAAAELAGAPLGLWILDESMTAPPSRAEPKVVEAITHAAAVFASTPSQRSALADVFQRKIYVVPLPRARITYPNLYALLFDTVRSHGGIADRFFEDQFTNAHDAPARHFDVPTPAHVHPTRAETFRFCERLKNMNWRPDFVVDIGASAGNWSALVSEIFPDALFVLCDPIFSRYERVWTKPGMIRLETALSDKTGPARFHVADGLAGSSLLPAKHPSETIVVPATTLDAIASEHALAGRGMMKVNVLYGEHLCIQGGFHTIANNIDVLLLEVTQEREYSTWTMLDIENWLDDIGFRFFDIVGSWRRPETGECARLNVAFVRRGLGRNRTPDCDVPVQPAPASFRTLLALRNDNAPSGRDATVDFVKFCAANLYASKSQLFQDLFVLFVMKGKPNGYFVDIGATNGVDFSNTYLLETRYRWTGILAEPARCWRESLRRNRSAAIDHRGVWNKSGETLPFFEAQTAELSTLTDFRASDVHTSAREIGMTYEVDTVSLDDLLSEHRAPQTIDYLSIDTEGSELTILEAFDFRKYDVNVITVEHNYRDPERRKIFDLLTSVGFVRVFEPLSRFDDWYVNKSASVLEIVKP